MNDDPLALAHQQHEMSKAYNEYAKELAGLKKNKAVQWLEIRKIAKTNHEADMMWEAKENGQRYLELKILMDGLSKELSGANALSYTLRSTNF
jgi:hypothetical protein